MMRLFLGSRAALLFVTRSENHAVRLSVRLVTVAK